MNRKTPDQLPTTSTRPDVPHKTRAALTATAIGLWSNVDYLAAIAGGELLKAQGTPSVIAAGLVAGVTTAETYATSHLATRGIGDYTYVPKTRIGKSISGMANASPVVSLWRGAGSGVIIDQATGRTIDTKRRLVHSVPYGVAVGLWVATPVPDMVVGVASDGYKIGEKQIETNPVESLSAIGILGAFATAALVHRVKRKKRS